MKIGIISDSHDHHSNMMSAVKIFQSLGVDYVLHAGDIVSPFSAKIFRELESSHFIAVYGNNDGEKIFLKNTIEMFGGEIHEYCYKGEIDGKRVYMTHTHHNIEEIVSSQKYDLVIYGHTHKRDIRTEGRTMVINPGESTDWLSGQGHIILLETDTMSYEIIPL